MTHSHVESILFSLLQQIVAKQEGSEIDFTSLSEDDWMSLYRISAEQGVLAIVFDAVAPMMSCLPRNLKVQWALSVEQIEKRYARQYKVSRELSRIYGEHGISVVVLKGLSLSTYYPIPSHREFGDFDCFLFDRYEDGNSIAIQNGATLLGTDYKHSHLNYKGVMVENHRYCTPIRGGKQYKEFELYLQHRLRDDSAIYLADSNIILPSATFNALFLARHSMTHFLYEGINLRHLLDWAFLLQREQNNIDWKEFYKWCDIMHLTGFVNTMNAIIEQYFHVEMQNPEAVLDSTYVKRMVDSILHEGNSVYTRGDLSLWRQRVAIVNNMISSSWKFSKIYNRSLIMECARALYYATFEKNPKL